jgi:hypothetical protein
MRRLPLLVLALALPASAAWTTEVLVLNSAAVTISAVPHTHGAIIQNRGPNSIFCASNGETPVLNKSLEIKTGGSLSLSGSAWTLQCRAATADQVTGAATIVFGVP